MRATTAKPNLGARRRRRAGTTAPYRALKKRLISAGTTHRIYAIIRDDRLAKRGTRSGEADPARAPKVERKPGLLQGQIWIAPDFDDSLELALSGEDNDAYSA